MAATQKATLFAPDINCGHCQQHINQDLGKYPAGIGAVSASPQTKIVEVEYDPDQVSLESIKSVLWAAGIRPRKSRRTRPRRRSRCRFHMRDRAGGVFVRASSVVNCQSIRDVAALRPSPKPRPPFPSAFGREPLPQALALQDARLDFGHVQPTPMLGCDGSPTSGQPFGLGRGKGLVERGGRVDVQLIHHQHDPLSVGKMDIDQLANSVRPVDPVRCALIRTCRQPWSGAVTRKQLTTPPRTYSGHGERDVPGPPGVAVGCRPGADDWFHPGRPRDASDQPVADRPSAHPPYARQNRHRPRGGYTTARSATV